MLKILLIDENAKMPTRAHDGDAGCDVYSPIDISIEARQDILIPLGWKCSFPKGHVMIIKEKSGVATKLKLDVGACVVDSSYRGIVHVHLFNNSNELVTISKGQKIAQFILIECWDGQPEDVKELDEDTSRGEGGFGSTGKF